MIIYPSNGWTCQFGVGPHISKGSGLFTLQDQRFSWETQSSAWWVSCKRKWLLLPLFTKSKKIWRFSSTIMIFHSYSANCSSFLLCVHLQDLEMPKGSASKLSKQDSKSLSTPSSSSSGSSKSSSEKSKKEAEKRPLEKVWHIIWYCNVLYDTICFDCTVIINSNWSQVKLRPL